MTTHRLARPRTLTCLALAALLFAGGACGDSEPIPPGTIVVDKDHDASIDEHADRYLVEARPSLRLELRGYELRAQGKTVDSVRVLGQGEFGAAWDGVSPIELGPETLKPVPPTTTPFPGFVAGVEYVIGAGAEKAGATRSTLDLMWAGQVDVRAAASR